MLLDAVLLSASRQYAVALRRWRALKQRLRMAVCAQFHCLAACLDACLDG